MLRLGVVVASVGTALLLRLALADLLRENAPLLVFVMAVMISAWYGGFLPGFVATVLSAIVGSIAFLIPYQQTQARQFADLIRLILFVGEGLAISILCELLHRSHRRLEAQTRTLIASEQRLARIVETNADPITIVDQHGRLEFANPAAEQLLRLTRSELGARDYNDPRWAISCPDGKPFPDTKLPFAQVAATNAPVYNVEHAITFPDKERLILSINAAPLRDEAGLFSGMVASMRDITRDRERDAERGRLLAQERQARAEVEAALAQLRRLQAITDIALSRLPLNDLLVALLSRIREALATDTATILLRNPQTDILEVRAALGLEEEVTQRIRVPVGKGFAGTVAARRQTLMIPNLDYETVISPVLRSEGLRALLGTPLLVMDVVIGVVHVGRRTPGKFDDDQVSLLELAAERVAQAVYRSQQDQELEQRVAERTTELETANAELEAFGYSVAHDLRAPVRAMQSFSEALLEDYGEQLDGLGRTYTERIVRAGERMELLIDDLLTYSRLSRADLSFSPVSLEQVLDDVMGQLTMQVAAASAVVTVERPLPRVLAHRATLVQVLANLLGNAVKFVAPNVSPQVHIRAVEEVAAVRVIVIDNGIGIAPEHQERIFRVFERLHGIEQYPGTGIGLAIVRKGVERMGGQVGVVSTPGHGCQFWFTLSRTETEG